MVSNSFGGSDLRSNIVLRLVVVLGLYFGKSEVEWWESREKKVICDVVSF